MKQRPRKHLRTISVLSLVMIIAAGTLHAQGPGVPTSLTIEQAAQLAVERNPSIALAQSRVETASARINGAFGAFLPQISVFGGYTKQLDNTSSTVIFQGVPISTSRPGYNIDAGASASLTLFDGFARSANYSGARNNFDASMQTLERTRQEIMFQARSAFLNALRAEQIIEIRRSDLDVASERLAQEKERVNLGAGLTTAVYAQEAEVANADLSLEQARTDVVVAHNTLSLLLNYDPSVEITLSSEGLASSIDSNEVADTRRRLGTRDELLERQTARRRDITAARLRVESASSSVTAARATYYPSISTSLNYNWQQAESTDPSASTTFALNLQYSPFDGFRTSEQVQIATAELQSAQIELRKLEIDVRSQLQQTLARLDGAERQLRAADRAVAAARQNRYATDERYRAGAGSYTDFLLANAQFLTAQINQVNAVFNYRLALYDVQYQVGE